jgi:YidC/Oxa1 family membrane protein insertase
MLLDKYESSLDIKHLDLAVDFGIYYFMTKPLFLMLHYFYKLVGNMGVAIMMLTIIVRTLVFPLANMSYKSFAGLRKIAPQMKEVREKYGDDQQRMQKELVALYEKEKVNPAAGCLPLVVQIPIFFALYKVMIITIELRHAPFFGWIHDLSAPDPTTLFNLFGLIHWDPPTQLMIGAWPCMMLAVQLLARNMNPPPQDKMQAAMINLMPFFFCYIMAQFASGLVVYWTFSGLLAMIQQYVIMRSMGVEVKFFGRTKAERDMAKQVAEQPAVHPGLEVLEHQLDEALEGNPDPMLETPEPDDDNGDNGDKTGKLAKNPAVKKKKR